MQRVLINFRFLFVLFLSFLLVGAPFKLIAGTIMVSNVLSNSVNLYDEDSLQFIKNIKVGYMPHEIVLTNDNRLALVSNYGDLLNVIPGHSITVIDILNSKTLRTLNLPPKSRPHGIAIVNDTEALITAEGIQSLLLVDFINDRIIKTLSLPDAGAHMVVTTQDKHFAYVSNMNSGSVSKINLKDFSIVHTLKIGKTAEGLALNKQEDVLLVTDRMDNSVAVIRTKDMSLLKLIKTDLGPVRVYFFDHDNKAIVINTLSSNAQIIDMNLLLIQKTIKTVSNCSLLSVPISSFIREDQKTAYVTNSFSGNVTLLDLTNGNVLRSFKNDFMPDGIAVSKLSVLTNKSGQNDTQFEAGPITINANVDKVWSLVKDVEHYEQISNGAITAHVKGELVPGNQITLELYKDKCIGKLIPKSKELITVVDHDKKILAWIRKLPDGNYTERYQILQSTQDNKTISSIVLKIPGSIGVTSKLILGNTIQNALDDLNNGIKAHAEG